MSLASDIEGLLAQHLASGVAHNLAGEVASLADQYSTELRARVLNAIDGNFTAPAKAQKTAKAAPKAAKAASAAAAAPKAPRASRAKAEGAPAFSDARKGLGKRYYWASQRKAKSAHPHPADALVLSSNNMIQAGTPKELRDLVNQINALEKAAKGTKGRKPAKKATKANGVASHATVANVPAAPLMA